MSKNIGMALLETLYLAYKLQKEKASKGEMPVITIKELEKYSNGRLTYGMASVYCTRLTALGYLKKITRGVYVVSDKGLELLREMKLI